LTAGPAMGIEDREVNHPPEGLRCPTCGARQGWTDTCRRCKSDLRLLRVAFEAYERHRRSSLEHLNIGHLEAALQHARKCQELWPGPEAHQLMAVCQLLRGDWLDAIALAWGAAEERTGTDA
jgi:hypothetical protein